MITAMSWLSSKVPSSSTRRDLNDRGGCTYSVKCLNIMTVGDGLRASLPSVEFEPGHLQVVAVAIQQTTASLNLPVDLKAQVTATGYCNFVKNASIQQVKTERGKNMKGAKRE